SAQRAEPAPPRRGRLLEEREVVAPDVRRVLAAEDAEGDGTPRLHRELAEPAVIVLEARVARLAIHALPRDLEDARVHLAHHSHHPAHPVPPRCPAPPPAVIWPLLAP